MLQTRPPRGPHHDPTAPLPAGLELALSPSGRSAAVVERGGRRVALLSAGNGLRNPVASFEPLPLSLNGFETPDLVTGVAWGPALGGGGGAGDSGGDESGGGGGGGDDSDGDGGGGERLLVVCQSSCLYLLDRCRGRS